MFPKHYFGYIALQFIELGLYVIFTVLPVFLFAGMYLCDSDYVIYFMCYCSGVLLAVFVVLFCTKSVKSII